MCSGIAIGPFRAMRPGGFGQVFGRVCSAQYQKVTKSAVNQYNEWRQWRTKQFPNQTPPPALDRGNADLLSRAIPHFLCVARKGIAGKRAEPYKADTIKAMYSSLNRYLVNIDPSLDLWKSATFAKCRTIVSGLIRNLRKKEKPQPTKDRATEITEEQELKLWR